MTASTAAATAFRERPVAAYAACRRLLRRHDPTFYLAVLRLPADVRPAVHALYGFVRGADEIVDGAGRSVEPAARLAALDAWECALVRGLEGGTSDHPVIAALVDAGLRLELPLDELRGYMRSMRVDCGPVRIATRAELDRYMDGSAASVGRVMAAILGARQEAETFGRLGVAFQLTNFVRDVRLDYELDRIYLPAESSSASAWMLLRSGLCRQRLSFAPCSRSRSAGRVRSSARRRPPSPLRCRRHGAACASRVPPTSASSTASRQSTMTSSHTRSVPARGGSRGRCLQDQGRSRDPQPTQFVGFMSLYAIWITHIAGWAVETPDGARG